MWSVIFQAGAGALGVAAFCALILWFVHFVRSSLPHRKLMALARKIVEARRSLHYANGPLKDQARPLDQPSIRELTHKLDCQGIPYPDLAAKAEVWSTYLGRLLGEARAGSVSGAKNVLLEMSGD